MPIDRTAPIDRERVVRTALTLLDEVGLDKLTLRAIASRLDVKAPALYWHFENKRALLDDMATTVLRESVPADRENWGTRGWQAFLRESASTLRAALLKYRDGAKMVPGTRLTDKTMYEVQEARLRVLVDAGFSADDAAIAFSTVYDFTVGAAIEEQEMYPRGVPDQVYTPQARLSRIDAERTPLVAELAATDRIRATDDYFERGLDLIVAGLENLLAQSVRNRQP